MGVHARQKVGATGSQAAKPPTYTEPYLNENKNNDTQPLLSETQEQALKLLFAGDISRVFIRKTRKRRTSLLLFDEEFFPEPLRGVMEYKEYVDLCRKLNKVIQDHRPGRNDKILLGSTIIGTCAFWPLMFLFGVPLVWRWRKRSLNRRKSLIAAVSEFNQTNPSLDIVLDKKFNEFSLQRKQHPLTTEKSSLAQSENSSEVPPPKYMPSPVFW
eukprot:m.330980 g.330980  ORF g.330980 m.330980 type:complete len:214 (-) comp16620_c0_seq1:107-748(-)